MTSHRRNVSRRSARAAFVLCLIAAGLAAQTGIAYALKVTPAPSSPAVTEGQSYNVVFTLDEPIISPPGDPDPNVTLSFAPADPSRVSFSPSTIQWIPSEWFQPRTLQVTAVANGIHDASNTDVVQVTTTSGSEYYDGFAFSFTVTITDIDPAPPTTTTAPPSTTTLTTTLPTPNSNVPTAPTPTIGVSPDQGRLPDTGAPLESTIAIGILMVAAGLLLIRHASGYRRPPRLGRSGNRVG